MTTALYLRFSPRPNAEEARSLEVQEERCRAYCAIKGLSIAHVIRDAEVSARTVPLEERDGGKELIRLVKAGEVKHIVVQKLDRIFRSLDGRHWTDRWDRRGVSLHLADQGGNSIDTGTAVGRFLMGQLLLVAELEPAMTAERTSGAMKKHQSDGYAMGGALPYGYQEGPPEREFRDGKLVDVRRIIEHPAEQETINRVRLLKQCGYGYRRIASSLESDGIPCRGKKWHAETVKRILERSEA